MTREQEGFEDEVFKESPRDATEQREITGTHQVFVAGPLPRLRVFEAKIDDDERECRDAFARIDFKKTPLVAVLQDELRKLFGGVAAS